MVSSWALVILLGSLSFCQTAYVETLPKCSFSDQECLKNVIQNVLKDISKTGIKELSIPPVDPIKLKNIQVSVLGLINITLEDGVAKGIKECVIDKIETELDKGHTQIEVTCDVIIKGKYNAVGASPIIKNLLGNNEVRGDGIAKVKIDKLHLKLDFYYDFIKKADGDIYIKCRFNKTIYEYDMGSIKISADRIFLGEQDFSDLIVSTLNENWKFVMQTFGKDFFDVAMDIFYKTIHKFFDNIPTKYFVTDDLTPYVKNLLK
ncbi:unnamed protein product, partial [Brenthis ino]